MEKEIAYFKSLLSGMGLSETLVRYLNMFILLIIFVFVVVFIDYLIKKFIRSYFTRLAKTTKTNFDDVLLDNHVPRNVAHIVPLVLSIKFIPVIFADFQYFESIIEKVLQIFGVFLSLHIVRRLFDAIRDYARTLPRLKDKPIDSFIQVIMIFLWITGILVILALITDTSVYKFITALGAASAILLLVFKDTILGFVASIQVSINDMVRIGDWITFDKYGADGNVTEINLATVKVQNFDKTITTIPTYALISDSFKNWRGMEKSGGRRIKRALIVKQNSVRFLSDEDVNRLKKIQLIADYLSNRSQIIEKYNTEHQINKEIPVNGRNLTNLGVFRKYIETYIEKHPAINKDMMIMTRQLAPTTQGIPIEIYAFSSDKRWQNYEYIMADIFDHVIAAIPYFGLNIFELPDNKMLEKPENE